MVASHHEADKFNTTTPSLCARDLLSKQFVVVMQFDPELLDRVVFAFEAHRNAIHT